MGNQFVGEQFLGFVHEIAGVRAPKAVNLPLDGFADRRMTVAQAADCRSPRCIEIPLTASVV